MVHLICTNNVNAYVSKIYSGGLIFSLYVNWVAHLGECIRGACVRGVLARFCGVGGKLLFPCEIAYYGGFFASIGEVWMLGGWLGIRLSFGIPEQSDLGP